METTSTTEDQACMALNSREKDKKGAVKDGQGGDRMRQTVKRDSRGEKKVLEGGDQSFVAGDQRRGGDRGRGGLGRGRPGAGRGGRSDKENDEIKGGRTMNGPAGRGRGGWFARGGRGGWFARGGRGNGRTFASLARGEREGESYHPIDVWENSQTDGNAREQALLKVGPLNDTTNGVGGSGPPPSNHIQSASNNSSADVNKMSANQESGISMSSFVQGLAGVGGSSMSSHVNAVSDLLGTLQSSYSNFKQVPVGVSNQALPPRSKVQRPRGPTSKISSSAVDISVTTLDAQFGGLDLSLDPSMSFSSVMQRGKSGGGDNIMYGGQGTKLDTFSSAAAGDKDIKTGGHPSSPFQNQINNQSQGSLNEPGKRSVASNISPGLDSLSSLSQNQAKTQQTGPASYGAAINAGSNTGSAFFVSYGKGVPGFPATGFPPVSQNPAGTYNNSSVAPVTGGPPPSSYGSQPLPSQTAQSGYHMGNMAYRNQPSNIQNQPVIASANTVQSANSPYGSRPTGPLNPYSMNSNVNSGYANSSRGAQQYGGYAPKMSGSMNPSTGVSSKASLTDVNASAPVWTTGPNVSSAQLGSSMQPGSGCMLQDWLNYQTEQSFNTASSASSNAKMSTSTNATTNASSNIDGTVPVYYNIQTPMYGYEDNSVQLVPRFPPGYYGATSGGAGYVTGAGVPVTWLILRHDGKNVQGHSTWTDARFQWVNNILTASPVPSNLAGGNTQQQAMYNPTAMSYYVVGNNMVHAGTHFPYGPPHPMYQTPMATAANTSGAPHAAAANHQYQSEGVYSATQYTYDAQSNVLESQLEGAEMGDPRGVYISQQPVQTLPMHQDGGNASRPGQVNQNETNSNNNMEDNLIGETK